MLRPISSEVTPYQANEPKTDTSVQQKQLEADLAETRKALDELSKHLKLVIQELGKAQKRIKTLEGKVAILESIGGVDNRTNHLVMGGRYVVHHPDSDSDDDDEYQPPPTDTFVDGFLML